MKAQSKESKGHADDALSGAVLSHYKRNGPLDCGKFRAQNRKLWLAELLFSSVMQRSPDGAYFFKKQAVLDKQGASGEHMSMSR